MSDDAMSPAAGLAIEDLERRHRDYFADLVTRDEPELRRRDQVKWLDLLEANHDNIRSALDWSIARGELETAMGMLAGLGRFWEVRGHWSEGRRRIRDAIAASTNDVPPAVVGRVALVGARLSGLYPLQQQFVDTAAAAAARAGQPELDVRLAIERARRSLDPDALGELERAVEVARGLGDAVLLADALWELGVGMRLRARRGGAARRREAVSLFEELGDRWGLAYALYDLAWVKKGAERRAISKRALQLATELGDDSLVTYISDQVCWDSIGAGDRAAAEAANAVGIAAARRTGDVANQTWLLLNGAFVYLDLGDAARARRLVDAHRRLVRDDPSGRAAGLRTLAVVEEVEGNAALASEHLHVALQLARSSGHTRSIATVLEMQARLLLHHGDPRKAEVAAAEALEVLGPPRDGAEHNDRIRLCALMANIAFDLGDADSVERWANQHAQTAAGHAMQDSNRLRLRALSLFARGDIDSAEDAATEAVRMDLEAGWLHWAAGNLLTLAIVCSARIPRRAARALGCAAAAHRRSGIDLPVTEVGRGREQLIRELRAALGEDFDAEWSAGEQVPIESALDAI